MYVYINIKFKYVLYHVILIYIYIQYIYKTNRTVIVNFHEWMPLSLGSFPTSWWGSSRHLPAPQPWCLELPRVSPRALWSHPLPMVPLSGRYPLNRGSGHREGGWNIFCTRPIGRERWRHSWSHALAPELCEPQNMGFLCHEGLSGHTRMTIGLCTFQLYIGTLLLSLNNLPYYDNTTPKLTWYSWMNISIIATRIWFDNDNITAGSCSN